jgi:hypothetical protein
MKQKRELKITEMYQKSIPGTTLIMLTTLIMMTTLIKATSQQPIEHVRSERVRFYDLKTKKKTVNRPVFWILLDICSEIRSANHRVTRAAKLFLGLSIISSINLTV